MKKSQIVLSVLTKDAPQSALKVVESSGLPHSQVIVVSNDSCDEAEAEIKKILPGVTFVQVRPSRGIAYCSNMGLRLPAGSKWPVQPIWSILANDDIVFDADWFARLSAQVGKRPNALHVNMAYPRNSYSCMVIHRDLIRKIGWWDERFTGMFFEDDDWHLRLCEYTHCAPGTRVHERTADGIFAKIRGARHDDDGHKARAKDRARFSFAGSLGKAPNKEFFYKKWKVVKKSGWLGKGLPGRFARHLPEVEWYPRSLLGGTLK